MANNENKISKGNQTVTKIPYIVELIYLHAAKDILAGSVRGMTQGIPY